MASSSPRWCGDAPRPRSTFEELVILNVKCGFHQLESWVSTSPAWRKVLSGDAGDFVRLRVSWIVSDAIDARIGHRFAWFI